MICMNNRIKIKYLNISFINKGFISDVDSEKNKYNYEKYLLDFVNNSKFILNYGNEKFKYREQQSNGEYDIYNSDYELDFKLFIPSDTVNTLNKYSYNISVDKNSAITLYDSESHGTYSVYNYLGLFNNLSCNDIIQIEKRNSPMLENEKEILRSLKLLKIKKNVLYLIPIEVINPNKKTSRNYLNYIIKKFNNYLLSAIKYRYTYIKKTIDTFFCFIFNNSIVILKCINDKLTLYDIVSIDKSELFMNLKDINTIWT